MAVSTVTVLTAAPATFPDGADGILRPVELVRWTGGVGPFTVTHEWDTVATFDSGALIQDVNAGATSDDEGVPPSDLGGGTWFYRATVTDTDDASSLASNPKTISYVDPITRRRFLYLLANAGVGFTPTDDPAGGWGPAPAAVGPDGDTIDFRRFLYLLANAGVGFYPTDTDDPAGAGDGDTAAFRRFLYLLANATTDTPTPHIWYVFPTFGREGWEFQIVGYGFGDTQAEISGSVTLNGLAVGIVSWELVAETSTNLTIDPITNIAEPIHQLVRGVVPDGASSGLVILCTDDGA